MFSSKRCGDEKTMVLGDVYERALFRSSDPYPDEDYVRGELSIIPV